MTTRLTLSALAAALLTTAAPAAELKFPPLPKAVSSFGAIACGDHLYVYGGHAGETHSYDTTTALGTFLRVPLTGGDKWEELPGGPGLQGLNLAAHGGKVYRVGGMAPKNEPGAPSDMQSTAECAAFDPKAGKWERLPDLPAGRSSHDVVVVGDTLVVVGGWEQNGRGEKTVWCDTALTLDLKAKGGEWKNIPQPFQRRAFTAVALGTKVYVIGGLTQKGTDSRVDVLDVATGQWTAGPKLPGDGRSAFSPAAAVVNGRVVVNTNAGPVFRLTEKGDAWETVGEAGTTRMVARLVPLSNDTVALIGGAGGSGNVAEVEVIKLAAKGEPVSADEKK